MVVAGVQETIQQGTSFGRPYTWYWFLEFSNGVPKENIDKYGRFLGYRIDSDHAGTYLSLRMYCRYDKGNPTEKEHQDEVFQKIHAFVSNCIQNRCPEIQENGFKIHFNNPSKMTYYECEFFRCYFNENVLDQKTNKAFAELLCKIRDNLQQFILSRFS